MAKTTSRRPRSRQGRAKPDKATSRRGKSLTASSAGTQPAEQFSLTEVAVETIRDRILDLTLPPSSRVDEKLLMQRFGLSRTPAREALNRLMSEGLIQMQPKKGAFVRPLDVAHVQQLFDAYFVSERMNGFFCTPSHPGLIEDLLAIQKNYEAAQRERRFLDMTRFNAQLHVRIARSSANEYVHDFSVRLQHQARRVSYFIYLYEADKSAELAEHQTRIRHDHIKIVETIRAGDKDALIVLLTSHAKLFHDRVLRAIGERRGDLFPVNGGI
jgi:DNA-binding GntR family transcriptional regulator